jgi:signal transduction histidine kinase
MKTTGVKVRRSAVPKRIAPSDFMLPLPSGPRLAGVEASACLELILRQLPTAVVICDMERNTLFANAAAQRLALSNPEGSSLSVAPNIWGDMSDSEGKPVPAHEWPWIKALRGETTTSQECRLVRSGQAPCDVLFSSAPLCTKEHQIIGAIATLVDITQHKRAESMIRRSMLDSERDRMGADIHDNVAQALNAVVLQLRAAEANLPESPKQAQEHFRSAQGIATESLAGVRRSIWNLSDQPLPGEDLIASLSLLGRQLFAALPVELSASLYGEPCLLSADVRHELLRIGKEALNNVLKHAHATKVHIRLSYCKREVVLYVFDNGRGFVPPSSSQTMHSFGLTGMRKRAARLGGEAAIRSEPGRGTQVIARVPLPLCCEISRVVAGAALTRTN